MSKLVLKRIGKLCKAIDIVFDEWVKSHYTSQEAQMKLVLLKKVKKQLEEQKRGFLKSKVNYSAMAEYLGENYQKSYSELQKKITKLI